MDDFGILPVEKNFIASIHEMYYRIFFQHCNLTLGLTYIVLIGKSGIKII